MIPYIGDISRNDAYELAMQASHDSILEFGCGASTQVLAAFSKNKITSIDTEASWIEKTKANLKLLNIETGVEFHDYTSFMNTLKSSGELQKYDFIFNDGADGLRRQFAIDIWPYLKIGGVLAFHDTRRGHDMRNVVELVANYHNEIVSILPNVGSSNITLIRKKVLEPYDNWQITENKQRWELGYEQPPAEFIEKLKPKVC